MAKCRQKRRCAATYGVSARFSPALPNVNKQKKVGNGNYLWISYFWSYLNEKGRAGFVMSSQASSAAHGEKDVRKKIVETGDVDVMISIRSNFFYNGMLKSLRAALAQYATGDDEDVQSVAVHYIVRPRNLLTAT